MFNIMGPSIAAAAALWGAAKTTRGRYVVFAIVATAVPALTPPVRSLPALGALPDPIEAYIRPIRGLTNYVLFPWMAYLFAGAIVGMAVEGTKTRRSESRVNLGLAVAGASLIAVGYAGSFLPSIYSRSDFWTTSPAYFAICTGVLTLSVAAAYLWQLGTPPLESHPAARAHVALHLLDSRRHGLRADVAAAASCIEPDCRVRGAGHFHGRNGGRFLVKGSSGGPLQGHPTHKRRFDSLRPPVPYAKRLTLKDFHGPAAADAICGRHNVESPGHD
jgi:hypothetical protein